MSKPWHLAVAVASTVAVAVCTGATADPGSDSHRTTMSAATVIPSGPAHIDSPLMRYMLTARQLALVNHARSILLSRCMAEHGFTYEPGTLQDEIRRTVLSERQDLSRLYGVTDPQVVAVYGYSPAPIPGPPRPALPDDDDYWLALTGQRAHSTSGAGDRKSRGCVGEADARLGRRPDRSAYGLARELWISNQQALQRTAAWRHIVNDWRSCMATVGYQVTSPLDDDGDIRAALQTRGTRASPSAGEVALASSDVRCKQQVQLTHRLGHAARSLDARTVSRQASELEADLRLSTAQMSIASRISRHAASHGRRYP